MPPLLSSAYRRPDVNLPEESCAAFLERVTLSDPTRIAVTFEGKDLSYGLLAGRVRAVTAQLHAAGVQRGGYLALCLPTTPAYLIWALAALQLGIAVVPIYDSTPAAELRRKCLAAAVVALVVDPASAAKRAAELIDLPTAPQLLIAADELGDETEDKAMPGSARSRGDDLALLPFSSGTTGDPKLILLSHRNVLASRLFFAQATALHPGSRLVHFLPLSHVYGWMALTAALGAGAHVMLHRRYDFESIVEDVERYGVTGIFAVSQTLIDMHNAPAALVPRLRTLRWINTGSAPLAPSVLRAVAMRYGMPVTTGYGLTEAAPVSHTAVERPDLIDVETVGFAAANTRLRLVDPDDPDRPIDGRAGELVVSGPQVALGYLAGDQLDRSSWLADGGFRTGDLVELDGLQRLRIVGRLKNIIKYKGYTVVPAELEALLAGHPDVIDCAVLGRPDFEAGEVPTAFIVTRLEATRTADRFISFMRERVAPQRCIRAVCFVDVIPRNPAGKVDTRSLLAVADAA